MQRACAASGQDVSGSTRAADRKRAPPAEQTAAGQAELRLGAVQLCASKQAEVAQPAVMDKTDRKSNGDLVEVHKAFWARFW